MNRRLILLATLLVSTPLLVAAPAYAEKPAVYTGTFSNLGAGGFDVVSYFSGMPVKGDKAYTATFQGAVWQFSSEANLKAFKADPAAYAPQYGGYCAWAVSQGYTAKGDPRYWAVQGGKLYLNYNEKVQRDWNIDREGFITKANANWPGVLKE